MWLVTNSRNVAYFSIRHLAKDTQFHMISFIPTKAIGLSYAYAVRKIARLKEQQLTQVMVTG